MTSSKATKQRISIYTDGSCYPNPGGPGGWAAILVKPDGEVIEKVSGSFLRTTNNRCELTAILEGVRLAAKRITEQSVLDVYTDSKYAIGAFSRWDIRQNTKNVDLILAMKPAKGAHSIVFHWLRGHDGNALNEECDRMALQARYLAVVYEVRDEGFETSAAL